MLLNTWWNIIFSWDCTSDQEVKWIFYAWGSLIREWVNKNNDKTHDYRCDGWWLYIKWVLIWKWLNQLMEKSRSHLNDWFQKDKDEEKKQSVMNWASVVIEYSPSIFENSTMSPWAEYFISALSTYKN